MRGSGEGGEEKNFIDPSHPNISIHFHHAVLYTFPMVLTRRIVCESETFFNLRSFTLFS